MILPVRTADGGYDIVLEPGALSRAKELLDLNRRVLVVTDSGVPAAYADTVAAQCKEAVRVTFPAGEASKTLTTFQTLLSAMLHANFSRGDCVVAVGGGVVGDLAGFAASCYKRGVDFYNVPTTLLSQVDSSIGGKTAVDFEGVKNAVGSFYDPKRVLIDPDTLRTLDKRLVAAGLAEAIKMAATSDKALFEKIEQSTDLSRDLPVFIEGALRIKADVVARDPKETGLRRVLNFGHTLGHAIESLSDGALYHGECVAIGMIPMCAPAIRARVKALLAKYGLPTESPFSPDALIPVMRQDKKADKTRIRAILVDEIGTFCEAALTAEEIAARMEETV